MYLSICDYFALAQKHNKKGKKTFKSQMWKKRLISWIIHLRLFKSLYWDRWPTKNNSVPTMSISGPDDAKTPTKVRQPPAKKVDLTMDKVGYQRAFFKLNNNQFWCRYSTIAEYCYFFYPYYNMMYIIIYYIIYRKQSLRPINLCGPINKISVRHRVPSWKMPICLRYSTQCRSLLENVKMCMGSRTKI